MIYLLLPVWQAEFALGYASLALVKTLFSGTLAVLQIPSTLLAQILGARLVLVLGTLLSAGGYALAGASGGLVGLCAALAIGGAGSSTQHPLASAVIARTYGKRVRGPLGTYNFAGDVGKAVVPPVVGGLLVVADWRSALWLLAVVGVAVAGLVAFLLPRQVATAVPSTAEERPGDAVGGEPSAGPTGFGLLLVIGMLDNAARPAFLIYLPFILQAKGASLPTVGIALSLVFIGGALGKAVCGRLGERLGVTRTVLLTEIGTALTIAAVVALPLVPTLVVLPLLGVMLNGTSSVLYGTVPELAPGGRVEKAFGLFYTVSLGGSAVAMPLVYGRLGDVVGPVWGALAAAGTALAVVPLMLRLAPHVRSREPTKAS